MEPWVPAPGTQTPPSQLSCCFWGPPRARRGVCAGALWTGKGVKGRRSGFGEEHSLWWFVGSLPWRQRLRRTSHGAPSSGGRGSSPVCTRALKAKGTAGHDGNCPAWRWSAPLGGLAQLPPDPGPHARPLRTPSLPQVSVHWGSWGSPCIGLSELFL